MRYASFIFKRWEFDPSSKQLELHYSYDDAVNFIETYRFNFDFIDYDKNALDQAIENLFLMAGVSYYKAYLAPQIRTETKGISPESAAFFSKTYQRGLGEFFYVNDLDPNTLINFPASEITPEIHAVNTEGLLIGVGGGKDSLVSIELLRNQPKVATWSMNHRSQLSPLVERIGLPHFWVERTWDPTLSQHNEQGAFNGHVPISAIFASVGTVVAILTGYRDVVVSNESSANEPTLNYREEPINHQYSKSTEFEKDYQAVLGQNFGESLRYYSFLRPLSELHIAKLFAKNDFSKYHDVFSSCNRAFVHGNDKMFWCGECSKCAFVFLALTPFIDRQQLESLWNGHNLLLDTSLEPSYKQLLGIEGDKPMDCVGEIKESRAAMVLAQQIYPELGKYIFELPEDYDYLSIASHHMPQEIYQLLADALNN